MAKAKRRLRRVTMRSPKPSPKMKAVAVAMLTQAEDLFDLASGLDTEVRDDVSEGLAYVVYAGYDTMAIAECVSDCDHVAYIQAKTYQWFRSRGFVEWFCAGASTLFKTSPRMFFRHTKATKVPGGVKLTKEKVA